MRAAEQVNEAEHKIEAIKNYRDMIEKRGGDNRLSGIVL
jgi:hypothetical protein